MRHAPAVHRVRDRRAASENEVLQAAWPLQPADRMQNPARFILILAVLAATTLGIATFTKHWRSAELGSRELNVGLRVWEECYKDKCDSAPWSEVKGKAGKSTTATLGPITFFVGIGAIVLLALLAGAVLFAPHAVRGLGTVAAVGTIAFFGLSAMYVMSFPAGFAPMGWSAWLGWAGSSIGITAGLAARKARSASA